MQTFQLLQAQEQRVHPLRRLPCLQGLPLHLLVLTLVDFSTRMAFHVAKHLLPPPHQARAIDPSAFRQRFQLRSYPLHLGRPEDPFRQGLEIGQCHHGIDPLRDLLLCHHTHRLPVPSRRHGINGESPMRLSMGKDLLVALCLLRETQTGRRERSHCLVCPRLLLIAMPTSLTLGRTSRSMMVLLEALSRLVMETEWTLTNL